MAIVPALAKILPDYDKHLDVHMITHDSVGHAIARGRSLTPDGKPPRSMLGTNLWVLAEHIAEMRL